MWCPNDQIIQEVPIDVPNRQRSSEVLPHLGALHGSDLINPLVISIKDNDLENILVTSMLRPRDLEFLLVLSSCDFLEPRSRSVTCLGGKNIRN